MHRLGDPRTHLQLMCRMGQHAGVDLAQAHATGQLTQREWADMVQACRRCAWGADCGGWLDQVDCDGDPPERCPNKSRFALLKSNAESLINV